MQNRPKDLALQGRDPAGQRDDARGDEMPVLRCGALCQNAPLGTRCGDVVGDHALGICVDHRADIGRKLPRIAKATLGHRACQHPQEWLCDIFLQIKHPQRLTALARGLKARGKDIAHRLFG